MHRSKPVSRPVDRFPLRDALSRRYSVSEHHLMSIGADRVDAPEATEVRSPFDGRVLGTVPTGTTEHIDAAVAAAVAALSAGPPPTH